MTMTMTVEPILASSRLGQAPPFTHKSAPYAAARPDLRANPLTQALDALDDALILTDVQANVVYVNRAARETLRLGSLIVRNGVLCAATAAETQELQRAIADRVEGARRAAFLRIAIPNARTPLLLTVTAPDTPCEGEPMVLVLVRDVGRLARTSARMIGTFFDLTPAESRLACDMVAGDGLKACAKRLGITPNTARTHLNRVFDKTGTKRQAELVRLLLSCRGVAGGDDLARVV